MNKLINFLYVNSITFIVIVFITFINGQSFPLVGNFVWLPIGAVSLCYLLFGYRIFIAVLMAITLSSMWFHDATFNGVNIVHFVGTFAPLLAIACMKFFKLSNFFDGDRLVFQHLLFLAILTALFNTLMKFFAFSYIGSVSIDAVKFIQGYLLGDILGCLTILFFAALVIVPGIRKFAPNFVPSEK